MAVLGFLNILEAYTSTDSSLIFLAFYRCSFGKNTSIESSKPSVNRPKKCTWDFYHWYTFDWFYKLSNSPRAVSKWLEYVSKAVFNSSLAKTNMKARSLAEPLLSMIGVSW